MAAKKWTTARRAVGNFIPLALVLGPLAWAVHLLADGAPLTQLLLPLGIVLAVGWISTALLGLIGNGGLKGYMLSVRRSLGPIGQDWHFVGFASPTYKGALDPHEDIGLLIFHDDKLEYYGESQQYEIPRDRIIGVRKRPNIHTWLLLGGWVSIDAQVGDKTVRMNIEPRDSWFLPANNAARGRLMAKIRAWKSGTFTPSDPEQSPDTEAVDPGSPSASTHPHPSSPPPSSSDPGS